MCDRTVSLYCTAALLLHWELNTGNLQLSTAPEGILPWRFHVDMQSFPSAAYVSVSSLTSSFLQRSSLNFQAKSVLEDMHSLNVSLPPVPPSPLIIHVPISPLSPSAHQQYCTVRWTDSHLSLIFLCFWWAGGPSKWHLKIKNVLSEPTLTSVCLWRTNEERSASAIKCLQIHRGNVRWATDRQPSSQKRRVKHLSVLMTGVNMKRPPVWLCRETLSFSFGGDVGFCRSLSHAERHFKKAPLKKPWTRKLTVDTGRLIYLTTEIKDQHVTIIWPYDDTWQFSSLFQGDSSVGVSEPF